MLCLAIETSCDETAIAILSDGELLASEVASQISIHAEFGGVVPEVASRNHLRMIRPVLDAALQKARVSLREVDAFAATRGPGLATSLMIGLSVAKGLAIGFKKQFIAINHMEGHLLSPFFRSATPSAALGLIVSGGHTMLVDMEDVGRYRILGQTQDDAAGEAFDKVGKLLGLPYPGGPNLNRIAKDGDPKRFDFPRSMLDSGDFSFSFSGLKTSVRYLLPKLETVPLADVCASFQEAVVDVLVAKTLLAAKTTGRDVLAVSGGVSCNSRLRERFTEVCAQNDLTLLLASHDLCTDNAGMIAYAAWLRLLKGESSPLEEEIDPNLRLQEAGL